MSRLALIPPHLMDMPFINDTRYPPGGYGYSDPLAFGLEMPVYGAFFDSWTGLADGPEQTHNGNICWDFDNYYDDEIFWGGGVSSDGANFVFEKKVIAQDGTLSSAGSYNLGIGAMDLASWPQKIWHSTGADASAGAANGWYYSSWVPYRTQMIRADKNRLVVFFAVVYYRGGGGTYFYAAATFDISTGTPVRSSLLLATSAETDGSSTQVFGTPHAFKISDYQFMLFTSDNSSTTNGYAVTYNTKTFRTSSRPSFQYSPSSLASPSLLAHRVAPKRTVFTVKTQSASQPSSLVDVTFSGNDEDTSAPVFAINGVTTGGNDWTVTNEPYHVRTAVFLTPSLFVQFCNGSGPLTLFNYSAGSVQQVSTLNLRPPLANLYPLVGIARLNNRELLIVYQDASDATLTKQVTQRVFINSDFSMSLGKAVTSYLTPPFSASSEATKPHQRMYNRGTVLPGNRVLMQHRRRLNASDTNTEYQGIPVTKMLRGNY